MSLKLLQRVKNPAAAACLAATLLLPTAVLAAGCKPTPWDEIGPFYKAGAPVRSSIGRGYVLSGRVLSAADCSPISKARIEIWQAGPNGRYDDAHRAAMISDDQGRYRLETDFPGGYAQRPPHIHILVDARGFEGLVTQHYPKKGAKQAAFDLVLVPERADSRKSGDRVKELVDPGKRR